MKEIYCFGTSQTAGGGFEFDSNEANRGRIITNTYTELAKINKNINVDLTQFNFSYPGHLSRLSDEYTVYNIGKSGSGNDRTIRKAYDIISNKNTEDLKNIFFIFEYAYLGRSDIFINELNKYVVCNYTFLPDKTIEVTGLSDEYFYENSQTQFILMKNKDIIENYLNKTIDFDVELNRLRREFSIFLSFLENLKIQFILLNGWPPFNNHYFKKNQIEWIGYPSNLEPDLFGGSVYEQTIKCETNGLLPDNHNNFITNKYISECIYNSLITHSFINDAKLNIKYPYDTITIN